MWKLETLNNSLQFNFPYFPWYFYGFLKKLFFHVSELPQQKGIMLWIVLYENL